MSSLVRKSVVNLGVVAMLAGSSFMASAEKFGFEQVVGAHIDSRVAEVQYYLDADLVQSIYANAFANANEQVNFNSRRTVVKMSDVEQPQEDEE